MKDIFHKRVHIVSSTAKLIYHGKKNPGRVVISWAWNQGLTWKGIKELSRGDGNVLYFDRDLGYTGVYAFVGTQQIYIYGLGSPQYINFTSKIYKQMSTSS